MGKKEDKIAAVAVVAALALVYALVPVPAWMREGASLRCALLHHFWHANVFHLAANSLVLLSFGWAVRRWYGLLPWAYAAASLSVLVAARPVIGFSNIIFAMSGLCATEVKGYWEKRETWVFIGMMAGMLFIPRLSAATHIASFAGGLALGFIRKTIRRTADDCRRAGG